jgi:hypothetical protein
MQAELFKSRRYAGVVIFDGDVAIDAEPWAQKELERILGEAPRRITERHYSGTREQRAHLDRRWFEALLQAFESAGFSVELVVSA